METQTKNTRSSNKTTYVSGTLYWTTSTGSSMPLKNIRVELYDSAPVGSIRLQSTYADIYGNYSFSFQNPDSFWNFENGGYDIFIRWYPESYTFQVARDWIFPSLAAAVQSMPFAGINIAV